MMIGRNRRQFLLIHGGTMGAWCWDAVAAILAAEGHIVITAELPGHGARHDEASDLEGYRDAVVDLMRPGVVLVGHSMGGYVATLAADARPELVDHIVYLAAGVPIEGLSMSEAIAANAPVDGAADFSQYVTPNPDGRAFRYTTLAAAQAALFHDATKAQAEWAFTRMVPQQVAPLVAPVETPTFWSADLPRSYILCTGDRAIPPPACEAAARQLNVLPLRMAGAHSPFLTQPKATSAAIVEALSTTPLGPPSPRPVPFEHMAG